MKKLLFLLSSTLVSTAFAQCPADPTTVLAGRWTIQITSGAKVVGNFTLVPGSYRFQTNLVAQSGDYVYQGIVGYGSYAFTDANCSQGIINLNNNFGPDGGGIQANFFIVANANYGRVITLRSKTNSLPPFPSPYVDPTDITRYTQIGTAWPAPTACPLGVAPVNSLFGTYNAISMSGITGTPSQTTAALVGQLVIGAANLAYQPSYLDPRGVFTMFLNPTGPTPPQQPISPPPAPLPSVSNNGDPGQYTVAPDCGSGQMWIYFAWPRSYNVYFFSRVRLTGAIDYVGLGHTTIGGFATTDVSIAR